MSLKLKVPSIAGLDDAENIQETIKVLEADARVDVDVQTKTVTVETKASEESIKQAVVAAGHMVEGYQQGD